MTTKFSIVVAVYNEEEALKPLLASIAALDYPRDQFEFVLVNDGSTDKTHETITSWIRNMPAGLNVNYINRPNNSGRPVVRMVGNRAAKASRIITTDARNRLFPDTLRVAEKYTDRVVIGNPLLPRDLPLRKFFYLTRKRLFPTTVGASFPDVLIDKENYEYMGKGTTIMLIDKGLLIEASEHMGESRLVNEDMQIFHYIVFEKNIPMLKTSKLRSKYETRTLKGEFKHMFERGPRFVVYHYRPAKLHFWLINTAFAVGGILILLIAFGHAIEAVVIVLIIDLLLAAFFARSLNDIPLLLFYTPIIGGIFAAGVAWGLIKIALRRS
jgi:glycosyltransferase involved in cell wall biosynthesis